MFSFARLLELAGCRPIFEAMTVAAARNLLLYYGVEEADLMSQASLKAARNRAMKQHHSDHGGDDAVAGEINAAYDVLFPTLPKQVRPGGNRNPLDCFQKRVSDKAASLDDADAFLVYYYATLGGHGHLASRGVVRANAGMFHEIAEGVLEANQISGWNTEAIFVATEHDTFLRLIWLDGRFLDGSVKLPHRAKGSWEGAPAGFRADTDKAFVRELPEVLDRIARQALPFADVA